MGSRPLGRHWTVKDLLDVLPVVFCEQITAEQRGQLRKAGDGASGSILNAR
jgi:hypothetical protein